MLMAAYNSIYGRVGFGIVTVAHTQYWKENQGINTIPGGPSRLIAQPAITTEHTDFLFNSRRESRRARRIRTPAISPPPSGRINSSLSHAHSHSRLIPIS